MRDTRPDKILTQKRIYFLAIGSSSKDIGHTTYKTHKIIKGCSFSLVVTADESRSKGSGFDSPLSIIFAVIIC